MTTGVCVTGKILFEMYSLENVVYCTYYVT